MEQIKKQKNKKTKSFNKPDNAKANPYNLSNKPSVDLYKESDIYYKQGNLNQEVQKINTDNFYKPVNNIKTNMVTPKYRNQVILGQSSTYNTNSIKKFKNQI